MGNESRKATKAKAKAKPAPKKAKAPSTATFSGSMTLKSGVSTAERYRCSCGQTISLLEKAAGRLCATCTRKNGRHGGGESSGGVQ